MTQSKADQNLLVLGYWAIRGLAEPSRLVLKYAKIPFTDKLYVQGDAPGYSRDEWLVEKETLGFGKLAEILFFLIYL